MDIRIIIYLSILLLVSVIGILFYKKINFIWKILLILIIFTFLSEVFAQTLAFQLTNSSPIYHFYSPIQYILMSYIYYHVALKAYSWSKVFFIAFGILYTAFCVCNTLFFQPIFLFPSNAVLVSGVLLLFQTLLTYVYMINNASKNPLHSQPLFWFNTGTFIFNSVAFFIFGYFNFLIRRQGMPTVLMDILWSINVVMYLCYAVSIIIAVKIYPKN